MTNSTDKRVAGATVLVTVGIDAKKQFLMETYGIPPDHIFSSRDPASFAWGVKRVTSGKGVDVVFNSLSGEGLVASWECIAPYGRFVEIGKKDILARNQLPMSGFEKNVTFSALDISSFPRDRPHVGRKALEEVFALIVKGTLKPAQPLQVYGVSEIEKAFRTMQSGKTFGKIVVDMRPDDIVEATLDTKPSFSLGADATYVIAGGLGGIGRSMARWLVERGARNLILVSRSGIKNQHAEKLIDELSSKGVKVATPACDVCDAAALKSAITSCLRTGMPPIRGCIQASMVLRDAAFAGMTHDAWQAATAPKVQGTWNLHTLLPLDMDFFVTLSSICGIVGSRGQANYGAGNTFQDALIRYRISLGQRAAALDLGPVFSIGVMTEDKDMRKRWQEMVDAPVTEADLFALLDYYCNPANDEGRDSQQTAPLRCQAVVGLVRWLSEKTILYIKKPISRGLTIDNNMAAGGRGADGKADQQRVNFASVFANAGSLSEATEAVTKALARKLSSTLSLTLEELDITTPMHSYGVDSLVAVELRNWFAKEVHADIAIFDILGGATIATAGALAAAKSKFHKAEWS
jgi:NADPH:quinone reductase-like Zn-dependent oxidoreductase